MSSSADFTIKNTVAQAKPFVQVMDVAGDSTNNSAPVFQSASSDRITPTNQIILVNSLLTKNRRIKQYEYIQRDYAVLNTANNVNY
jgi:hypothetical protein